MNITLSHTGDGSEQTFKAMSLTFHVPIPEEEGGQGADLIANGNEVAVTPQNVFHYVKLYAEYRMLKVSKSCLSVGI